MPEAPVSVTVGAPGVAMVFQLILLYLGDVVASIEAPVQFTVKGDPPVWNVGNVGVGQTGEGAPEVTVPWTCVVQLEVQVVVPTPVAFPK
jgi:hypothetical protein